MARYEDWALDEMEELGMNEIEYCNAKGYNLNDILTEDGDSEDDEDDY